MPHARATKSFKPNRTDLTKPTDTTVPGQGYGEAAQQRSAQQAIPMGPPPTPTPSPAPVPSPAGAVATALNPSALAGAPMVGANGPLTRPTERPNEPVTHGLPMGPGAGPEALQGIGAAARQGAVEQGTLVHLLDSLAAQPMASSAVKDLAARAQSGVI